jgi:LacI family transcriptional regulator
MATLKEIANMANVSIGTVDRVIHRRGRVSQATASRVQQIIRDVEYKPNILARSLSSTKSYLFGVLIPLPEQDGHYWELPHKGIAKAQQELQFYKVEVEYYYYDKYSEVSFEHACRLVLRDSERLDGLLIAPVLSKEAEKFITLIPSYLPYIFLDSYIPNSKCLSYIGEDSFQSGVLSAKLMQMLVGRQGTIALIKALPFDYHIEDRIRGFKSFFESQPSIKLAIYEVSTRDSQSFETVTRQILQENPDLDGIFTSNACSFHIAKMIKASSVNRKIHIIGYDLIEQNISCLQEGTIDFLISQRSEMQGYTSIYKLYKKIVLKEKIESEVLMPLDIITQENLQYYQN